VFLAGSSRYKIVRDNTEFFTKRKYSYTKKSYSSTSWLSTTSLSRSN